MIFRVKYEVKGHLSFLSHLEMMRLWQRALLRTHLPIAWSQGFNPRPKLSLGPAKGVGIVGLGEYIDMEFKSYLQGERVMDTLNAILPAGLQVLDLRELPPHTKLLEAVINEAAYEVHFTQGISADFQDRINAFMARDSVPFVRRSPKKEKELDLRAFVYQMKIADDSLLFWLKMSPMGAARPTEILTALGCGEILADIDVVRTGLYIREGSKHSQP